MDWCSFGQLAPSSTNPNPAMYSSGNPPGGYQDGADTMALAQRSRKSHTRSRTGCLPCRKRHMKCDETRPSCVNCIDVSKACVYPSPVVPLRERKKDAWLPGEQKPWMTQAGAKMPLVPSRKADPFSCLPGTMPFRSTELFHYFCNADATIDWDTSRKHDGLALAAQDPAALRGAILFAALHYTWRVGNMENFESTFLFHKIEAMRHLNGWLKNIQPRLATACITEICTLTFTECCLGNIQAAETHIDGLMRFMDQHRPLIPCNKTEFSLEDELSNRYLLITYNFLHGIKSRLDDNLQAAGAAGLADDTDPVEAEHFIRTWHSKEVDGSLLKLRSMRLLPTFFSLPSEDTKIQDIDGFPIVSCTREMTQMNDLRKIKNSPLMYEGGPLNQIWLQGAATRLLLDMVNLHMQSMYVGRTPKLAKKPTKGYLVSWSGVSAALSLYLNYILGIWNAGQPLEVRLHRRVLCMLKTDLDREDYLLESEDEDEGTSNFWLWRAFLGAFSIAKHKPAGDQPQSSRILELIYEGYIQKWIKKTGLAQWKDARKCLASIVWPRYFGDEGLAAAVWESAALMLDLQSHT